MILVAGGLGFIRPNSILDQTDHSKKLLNRLGFYMRIFPQLISCRNWWWVI
jgi:hypothetical protein